MSGSTPVVTCTPASRNWNKAEALRQRNNEVDLGTVSDLRESLILHEGPVLLQLKRHDAVDVVVGDLQDVVVVPQAGSVYPVQHSLVVVQITGRAHVKAEIGQKALFNSQHWPVIRMQRLQFPV